MSTSHIPGYRLYEMGGESMVERYINSHPSVSLDDKKYSMKFDSISMSKERPVQIKKQQNTQKTIRIEQPEHKELGVGVFQTIRERYRDVNKMNSIDADVLYEFYMSNRRQNNEQKEKRAEQLKKAMANCQKLNQKQQQKLACKLEFDKYLGYEPRDVYYTLMWQSTKLKKDMKIQEEIDKKNPKPQPKVHKKAISPKNRKKLYEPSLTQNPNKASYSPPKKDKSQEHTFAQKLIELFRDRNHTSNPMTIDALYNFWISHMARSHEGNSLPKMESSQVKPALHKYMAQQIQNLIAAHNQKKGFECSGGQTLLKFLGEASKEALSKYEVSIPERSFNIYLEEFNKYREEAIKKAEERKKEHERKKAESEKQLSKAAMTRPASATPLKILAEPKRYLDEELIGLVNQYPHDKKLKEVLKSTMHPKARRPQQYGVYEPAEQIRIKGWTRGQKGDPDKLIQATVMKSTLKGFGLKTQAPSSAATVKKILDEEYLEDDERWNNSKQNVRSELKILAYNQNWCRNSLISFVQKQMRVKSSQLEDVDDNHIVDRIVEFLSKLGEGSRKENLAHLAYAVKTGQVKGKFEAQQKNLETTEEQEKKMEKAFNWFMEKNAKKYIKLFLTDGQEQPNDDRLHFLKGLYEQAKSQHTTYVNRNYPMVQSAAHHACPKEFKYEFFKVVKQINRITKKRDRNPKSHIWAPTSTFSDKINQNTFNQVVRNYSMNKAQPEMKEQQQQRETSPKKGAKTQTIWTKDKLDDRLKLMMKYEQAKECTFKPVVHKMVS